MKNQVILAICLVLLIGTVLAVDPSKVGDWWGTVKVNGEYANGAVVDAYIDNVKVESTTVGEYESNYYLIHVEGNEGDVIVFKVNGKEAVTENWSNGNHELDLNVTIDTTVYNGDDTPTSPGGGGSNGGDTPSETTPIIITAGTTDNQTTDEQDDILSIESLNEKTTDSGITGGVIGFVKSGVGKGLIIAVLVLIGGITVINVRKKKPLKE